MPSANPVRQVGNDEASPRRIAQGARELVSAAEREALREEVEHAIRTNARELEEAAWRSWRSVAWGFVAALVGNANLAALEAETAMDRIEPVLEELDGEGLLPFPEGTSLWGRALGEEDSSGRKQDPVEDFLALWERRDRERTLAGAIARARVRESSAGPSAFGSALEHPRRQPLRVFLALCGELAQLQDGRPFPLAVQAIAEALGVERHAVGRWRAYAEEKNWLVRVAEARRGRTAAMYQLGPNYEED